MTVGWPAGPVDLLVVGGGINGAGIARDAAGRGLSVLLVEREDLAQHTSSASTKLIHGGLRYLEHYEFRLVREALEEREVLLAAAPHIIWPLEFVLPHEPHLRPWWLIRAGLFLYDRLAPRRRLRASRGLDLRRAPEGAPLRPHLARGFVYADCWVDDARLVVLNALDAGRRGAIIRTRTRLLAARRQGLLWLAELAGPDGRPREIAARALVNAAGPWTARLIDGMEGARPVAPLRLVKGSHIVVPRLYEGAQAYILQNADRRIVFAIPYEERFTLVGTTDVDLGVADPGPVAIDAEEIGYLCAIISSHFRRPLEPADVVWSYAGVRPLAAGDDKGEAASAVTRDYTLALDAPEGAPPLLSVLGGKITTYRRLAESALARLQPCLGFAAGPWTRAAPLPGGGFDDPAALAAEILAQAPGLGAAVATRWMRAYGTEALALAEAPGRDLGAGLHEAELQRMVTEEWAETADDVLWRRSKRGLHGGVALAGAVSAWLDGQGGRRTGRAG